MHRLDRLIQEVSNGRVRRQAVLAKMLAVKGEDAGGVSPVFNEHLAASDPVIGTLHKQLTADAEMCSLTILINRGTLLRHTEGCIYKAHLITQSKTTKSNQPAATAYA